MQGGRKQGGRKQGGRKQGGRKQGGRKQGGRKQGGTRCWCPPTLHRPLQLCIVCVTLCGDSKCFTIFTLYLYNKV